eukprot:1587244-Amphidinium_carterae.1
METRLFWTCISKMAHVNVKAVATVVPRVLLCWSPHSHNCEGQPSVAAHASIAHANHGDVSIGRSRA